MGGWDVGQAMELFSQVNYHYYYDSKLYFIIQYLMKTQTEKTIIDDRFRLTAVNPEEKYFKNVSRVHLQSDEVFIELDINTNIYPIEKGESFLLLISKKAGDKPVYIPEELAKPSEKDNYEYVMYGTVFEIDKEKDNRVAVFASFGGLLMKALGSEQTMSQFRKDSSESRIYLMLKRV